MTALSLPPPERARKIASMVLQRLQPGELSYLRELRRRVEDHAEHLLNEDHS